MEETYLATAAPDTKNSNVKHAAVKKAGSSPIAAYAYANELPSVYTRIRIEEKRNIFISKYSVQILYSSEVM